MPLWTLTRKCRKVHVFMPPRRMRSSELTWRGVRDEPVSWSSLSGALYTLSASPTIGKQRVSCYKYASLYSKTLRHLQRLYIVVVPDVQHVRLLGGYIDYALLC